MSASEATQFPLPESAIPTHWVNLLPDLPGEGLPPLHPETKEPLGPEDLAPIFPMSLIEQEVSSEPEIEIPDEVREVYKLWRPTPLLRARRLEKLLDTPAHIYWAYRTVAASGDMWGLRFRFVEPPSEVARFERSGRTLTGTGSGTVGIRGRRDCRFSAQLPFERRLPRACLRSS